MSRLVKASRAIPTILAAAAVLAVALPSTGARAEGGDRMPAGGAFMSSYVTNPYADTRSPYAQQGQPAPRAPWLAPEATGSLRPHALPHRGPARR
ncbi:hypothetical protein OPKNFCMD_6274 [Methylobacterium crusticola]|uniref:Uncharacterized protein n=1 Tax=Methylobacterium crusticola TaxID=1697972 RepID=A0ABQ4R722_9HYPH|nr:hypothetical protein [Methylobacterium crusticola]GJD53498.1 hypothetical protein OPKNFCMD_6274 [Methylobacterium crusticola]